MRDLQISGPGTLEVLAGRNIDLGAGSALANGTGVGINALLCGWFGSTLRPDRLSLIGQFAQRIHPLTPTQRVYTAAVTRVWAAYFAAVSLLSLVV